MKKYKINLLVLYCLSIVILISCDQGVTTQNPSPEKNQQVDNKKTTQKSVETESMALSQECDPYYSETLKEASYYTDNNSDFNCYQYVRAYFDGSNYGAWEPPANNNIADIYSSQNFHTNNDPHFEQVSDPDDADIIYYHCDHAAVILSGGCFVEKINWNDDLRKFGSDYTSCAPGTETTYYKYIHNPSDPEPEDCIISGTWVSDGSELSSINSTDNYFNEVEVSCSTANSFNWSIKSGNVDYSSCSNSSCSRFYFYLSEGQSVTFNVKGMNDGYQVGSKDYSFYRN